MDFAKLSSLLKDVEKPSQYLGNEVNSIHKDFSKQSVRVALVFPDKYEIGMSHMGLKILYDILNSIEGVVAERCFAPGPDFEAKLRAENYPLYGLESKTPLSEFDVIGISLPYELTYTNVVSILDLAKIPVWQKDRKEHHPFILGGGTGSYNPEPVADFFDMVAVGDSEELILEFIDKLIDWKKKHQIDLIKNNQVQSSRLAALNEFRKIEGVYVPSFFEPTYNEDGTLKEVKPLQKDYTGVKKRVVNDLNAQPYPTKLVLPNIKIVHDRIGVEIQRGCTRMCRFCQAGYVERPKRQRSPERVLNIIEKSYEQTGIDEISLLSLSAGDYGTIVPTMKELNKRYSDKNVSISVPATRTETLTPELIEQVKQVRKTGFTIAPEAGSERMRRVINKGNKVEDLMQACRNAFSAGYQLIKFYYLCGIPFEHDEDLIGMADEAGMALDIGREYTRKVDINVSVSTLVPKPFTPFQWDRQVSIEETRYKHNLIKRHLKDKRLHFKCHQPEMSFLEGVFSRGDRRLSKVIYKAFENGCRLDEWSEHFDYAKWQKTFDELNVDLDFYVHRERKQDEILPWEHLFIQMRKEWLWQERERAREEAYNADCAEEKCQNFCGACDFKTVKNKIYVIDDKELAAKKGNREWYGRFGKNFDINKTVGASALGGRSEPAKIDGRTYGAAPMQQNKIRVYFSKTGLASLFGHLELMGHIKRAITRVGVPVAYSEGFHPQMKLSMGYALPLGLESECESFDLVLTKRVDLQKVVQLLNDVLPDGLTVTHVESVDLKSPSIYSLTKAIDYQVQLSEELLQKWGKNLEENWQEFKNGKEFQVIRERKGRQKKKSRTLILNGNVVLAEKPFSKEKLEFRTYCDADGTSLKPTEVVMALGGIPKEKLAQLQVKKVGVHFHS